jgi:polysaccharide biosynthesis PFTS motif protein
MNKFQDLSLPPLIMQELIEKIQAINTINSLIKGNNSLFKLESDINESYSNKRALIDGLKTTTIVLFALIRIAFSKSREEQKKYTSLVYALPFSHIPTTNDQNQISEFIDENLGKAGIEIPDKYIIQNNKLFNISKSGREKYVFHIGVEVLTHSDIRMKIKFKNLVLNYVKWIRLVKINKIFSMIGTELIIDNFAFSNPSKLNYKLLITTQSQILKTPLSFKILTNSKKVMFWYSNNSRQIHIKNDVDRKLIDYSYLNNKLIDLHFVWTESWAKELTFLTGKQVISIGPILFTRMLNPSIRTYEKDFRRVLTIFDVTPKKNVDKLSFYSTANMMQFTKVVLEVVKDTNFDIKIQLKSKRSFQRDDCNVYVNYLKSIRDKVIRVSPNTNIESLIRESDLVVCVPYTSPALVAQFFKKPVAYFWPNDNYLLEKEVDGIEVLIGIEQLKAFISKTLGYP